MADTLTEIPIQITSESDVMTVGDLFVECKMPMPEDMDKLVLELTFPQGTKLWLSRVKYSSGESRVTLSDEEQSIEGFTIDKYGRSSASTWEAILDIMMRTL